ncbi:MAG: hypothetical protein JXJ18_06595 [Rhodobacteraceae bacterium]|nr:hypothetical protein [Paracoccaceae bacterium]
MAKTELKIEHVDPGADGVPGGVRLTATVPWSEMNRRTMDRFVERRVAVPDDSTPKDEDDVYVSNNGPIDYDALLLVGAVPALVAAVARLRPFAVYGVLNGYAWEMEEQRNRVAKRDHRDRNEELWLSAQMMAVSKLLRELRFADFEADGYTRAELLKEERLIGGAEYAAEQRELHAS